MASIPSPVLVGGDTNLDSILDLNEVWVYSAVHTVTQEEIDLGDEIINLAAVNTDQTGAVPAVATVAVVQLPSIDVAISPESSSVDGAGDATTFEITVSNTGNLTLTDVVLDAANFDADPTLVMGDSDGDQQLDVGESWTYAAARTVTQAEVDAGTPIEVDATASSAQSSSETDTAIIHIDQMPAVGVSITPETTSVDAVGETSEFEIAVTNSGNVSLTEVTLDAVNFDDSPIFVGGDTDSDQQLDVSEVWTYTAMRTVTAAEISAGTPLEVAVTANTTQATSTTAVATIGISQSVELFVIIVPDVPSVSLAGQVIGYQILVSNSGNISLSGIVVESPTADTSPVFVSGDEDNDGELDPAETWEYSASQTVTQQQIQDGQGIVGVATADSNETGLVTATTLTPVISSDFNFDGTFDGDDFLLWQAGYAQPGGPAEGDANGDGFVDGLDFLIWQTQFSLNGQGSGASLAPVLPTRTGRGLRVDEGASGVFVRHQYDAIDQAILEADTRHSALGNRGLIGAAFFRPRR